MPLVQRPKGFYLDTILIILFYIGKVLRVQCKTIFIKTSFFHRGVSDQAFYSEWYGVPNKW